MTKPFWKEIINNYLKKEEGKQVDVVLKELRLSVDENGSPKEKRF